MRIEGPYPHRQGYRCRIARESGRVWCPSTDTPEQALRLAELCLAEIVREALSVSEAINLYEVHLRDIKGNKPASCKATALRIRRFFHPTTRQLGDLTAARCARLYNDLVTQPSETTGRPVSVDTHRNYLAEAKTFLGWCVEKRWLRDNPLGKVRGIGRRKHGKEQLTIDEARRWLTHAMKLIPNEPGALAASLLLICGLRSSEVVDRVVRDLDDRGKILRIPTGKTRAASRLVGIPESIRPYLIELCAGRLPTELIFGQHWRDWPRHWVNRICKAAGVPVVCAHSMRGLHATLALAAGQTPYAVAACLGHESPSTTLESYAAPGSAEAAAAVRAQKILAEPAPELVPALSPEAESAISKNKKPA